MSESEVRILVAEDDVYWQSDLCAPLEGAGFTVELVATYDAAIAGLQSPDIGLAVIDMSLKPGDAGNVDGLLILRWLEEHELSTPVVLLSAYSTVEMLSPTIRQLRCNVVEIMSKGEWDAREFLCLVRRALGLPQDEPPDVQPYRSRRPAPPPRPKSANGFDVLVVEDDWAWREDFRDVLAAEGYAVTVVSTYAQALSHLHLEPKKLFDVAVVDFRLADSDRPDDGGYRLLADLQAAGIPVVVVSGLGRGDLVRGALREYGVHYCFSKADLKWTQFKDMLPEAERAGIRDEKLASLTPTEHRIVKAICQGNTTDKEIASHLDLKEQRIRDMVHNILKKLELKSRAQITPYVLQARRGWQVVDAAEVEVP